VDVWRDGPRVAIGCKLAEAGFGTCSRPRLKPTDRGFAADHCDGTYIAQRGRSDRCPLTEAGIEYWWYVALLFGWDPDRDHQPCPLGSTYQLVGNVLAAGVGDDGVLRLDHGHALILFDQHNPAMAAGGEGDRQWQAVVGALRPATLLRRLSWQSFIAQWPRNAVLDWLKSALKQTYGL
jgi:hypothetical protein